MRPNIFLLALAVLLSACGFTHSSHSAVSGYSCISIPYPKGDLNGDFATELGKAFSEATALSVNGSSPDLELFVQISETYLENIGHRRRSVAFGKQITQPCEARLTVSCLVQLLDTTTKDPLPGFEEAHLVTAEHCYDYVPESFNLSFTPPSTVTAEPLTRFSQGQMNKPPAASRLAQMAAYRTLAKQVVDFILSNRQNI